MAWKIKRFVSSITGLIMSNKEGKKNKAESQEKKFTIYKDWEKEVMEAMELYDANKYTFKHARSFVEAYTRFYAVKVDKSKPQTWEEYLKVFHG